MGKKTHFLSMTERRVRGIPTFNEHILTGRLLRAEHSSKGWGWSSLC